MDEDLKFLNDSDLSDEIKLALIEKQISEKKIQTEKEFKNKSLFHNTPLMVAIVGTITIFANFIVSYILNNQNSAITETKSRSNFSYQLIQEELSRTNTALDRARALLFLARSGVLKGLNVEELEKYAKNSVTKADGNPNDYIIPDSIGRNEPPDYNLAVPALGSKVGPKSRALLRAAIREINLNVLETAEPQTVGKYWRAVNRQFDGTDQSVPWSGAFISWLLDQADIDDQVRRSAGNLKIWQSAVNLNATFLPGEQKPMPGDVAFFLRGNQSASDSLMQGVRSGNTITRGHAGVVFQVEKDKFTMIAGNVRNGTRLSEYELANTNLVGFARFDLLKVE